MRAFVIAMENEAAAVRPCLRADDRLVLAGIGKVNAAMATQRAIDEGATEIWNCGVAGGFDPSMKIGEVCIIDRAVQYDFDLAKLNGTRIGQLNERESPYFTLPPLPADLALSRRTLATGDRFTDSENDLPLLADLGATVRDMEGAAIAHVCEKNGVPCRIVKAITNVQGLGSMTGQYEANCDIALRRLSDALRALLQDHG